MTVIVCGKERHAIYVDSVTIDANLSRWQSKKRGLRYRLHETMRPSVDGHCFEVVWMSNDRHRISYEEDLPVAECADHLQSVVDGLRAGKWTLSQGDRSLQMRPSSVVNLEIKAKQKASRGSLTVELSWDSQDELVSTLSDPPESATTSGQAPDAADEETL